MVIGETFVFIAFRYDLLFVTLNTAPVSFLMVKRFFTGLVSVLCDTSPLSLAIDNPVIFCFVFDMVRKKSGLVIFSIGYC